MMTRKQITKSATLPVPPANGTIAGVVPGEPDPIYAKTVTQQTFTPGFVEIGSITATVLNETLPW